MSDAPSKIGPYPIDQEIGRGGMGVVYLATDPALGRKVALKSLPDEFSTDPSRLSRFEQEARALASLNHTNIASIHGLQDYEGTKFLVLEYAEGDTLSDRLSTGGPMPVDEALRLCTQIASGLEAAHDAGIIHRDLKPQNIKVTPAGEAKILDFGLAKSTGAKSELSFDSGDIPTATSATAPGMVMGTPGYLSPEQARGKAVDKRTDIWSFGCVLYDCLTGEKVFPGETPTDSLVSVLEKEPDWEKLPEKTPVRIRELLMKCLAKDVRDRLRDIGDARLELERALSNREWTTASLKAAETSRPLKTRRSVPALTAVLAFFLVAIIAGLAGWMLNRPADLGALPPMEVEMLLPPSAGLIPWAGRNLTLSPDGSRIIYVGSDGEGHRLYQRLLTKRDATPIPGTEGAADPCMSPGGKSILFTAYPEAHLKKVGIDGGVPVTIVNEAVWPGASWGEDGFIYFVPESANANMSMMRVAVGGGIPEKITEINKTDGETFLGFPQVLPGGRGLLLVVRTEQQSRIAVLSLETGERKIIIESGTSPQYLASGHLVYFSKGLLMAVRFDIDGMEPLGTRVPLVKGVQGFHVGAYGLYSVSPTGVLAYVPFSAAGESQRSIVKVDRAGDAQLISTTQGAFHFPRLSPDGKNLLLTRGEGGNFSLWVFDLHSETLNPLTFDDLDFGGIWSSTGSKVTHSARAAGSLEVHRMSVGDFFSSGEVLTRGAFDVPTSWSPNGNYLAVTRFATHTWEAATSDVWIAPDDLTASPKPFLMTPNREMAAVFSPDGDWLAYVSDETGRNEIYVRPFPGPGRKSQVSIEGGDGPVWRRDGKELFYRNGKSIIAVSVETKPDFKPGKPQVLFQGDYAVGCRGLQNFDVSRDGSSFYMITADPGDASSRSRIHLVLNWLEEVNRLVPLSEPGL